MLGNSSSSSFYVNRFLVLFWFLVVPFFFLAVFLFIKEIGITNRRQQIVFSRYYRLRHYGYVLHNFLFMLVVSSCCFNLLFLIYSIIDLYLLEFNVSYSTIWHIPTQGEPPTKDRHLFFTLILAGTLFHIVFGLVYIYYNLYETDSYFGDSWRKYLIRHVINDATWNSFRKKHPHLYSFLYDWFLSGKKLRPYSSRVGHIFIDY